jgi:hypothetical protein
MSGEEISQEELMRLFEAVGWGRRPRLTRSNGARFTRASRH